MLKKKFEKAFNPCVLVLIAPLSLVACSGGSTGSSNSFSTIAGDSPSNDQAPGDSNGGQLNADSYLLMMARDKLYRVSASNGDATVLSELPTGIDFIDPVDIVDEQVIVTADDNTLNSIDLITGTLNWEYVLGPYDTFGKVSTPYCTNEICYAMGSGYQLNAVNVANRTTLWTRDFVTGERETGWSATTSLLVAGNNVFVVGDFGDDTDSTLTVLDKDTGVVVNTIAFNDYVFSSPRVIGSSLIVPTYSSLRAYDIETSQLLWQTGFAGENDGLYGVAPLTVAGDVVAFNALVDNDNDDEFDRWVLVGVDTGTGSILWTVDAGEAQGIRFNPQSDNTTIYSVESRYDNLLGYRQKTGVPFAVDAATGRIVWKNDAVEAKTEPLVAAGNLYFGEMNISDSAGRYSGFGALAQRTGQATLRDVRIFTPYSRTPAMVHNNKTYRADPWPTYTE